MNTVRITYIVCDLIFCLAMMALAIASPVWITPGVYWWTGFALFLMFAQSYAFTKRLNSWGEMGEV
jgi:hypothetical protein